MAICHGEKVCSSVFSKMRKHKERILIDLIRILWRVPSLRGKRKFGYTIIKLFTRLPRLYSMLILGRGRHLLRNRSPHILSSCLCSLFSTRKWIFNADLWIAIAAALINCVVGRLLRRLHLILAISLFILRRCWFRYNFGNVWFLTILVGCWQIKVLIKAAMLRFGSLIAVIDATLVCFHLRLKNVGWIYWVFGWFARCTRLPSSIIPLLRINITNLVRVRNHWRMLHLVLRQRSKMMGLVINLTTHNLITARFINISQIIAQIERSWSTILTLLRETILICLCCRNRIELLAARLLVNIWANSTICVV